MNIYLRLTLEYDKYIFRINIHSREYFYMIRKVYLSIQYVNHKYSVYIINGYCL